MMQELINQSAEYLDMIFSQLFTKFVVAVIILLIGFVIGRILSRIVYRILHEVEVNRILEKAGVKFELEGLLSHGVMYFVYFVTIIWALNTLGLTTTILNMISGAFLVLIIVSILLAVKDFMPNLISGFFIYQKGMVKPGDRIRIDNLEGKISKISLIETEIKTDSGDMIHIPNSSLTKKEFIVKKKG